MNFSELFIRRPVMTTVVMGAILIFGAMAYRLLPVSDLPNVDFPTISVSASLPGANPDTMAASVATPLEKEFSTIAGVDSMTSTSGLGSTNVTLQFALDRDIDAAAQDVQAAIARTSRQLPPDMPFPPTYRKVNPADQPILFISLTSPSLPLYELDEYGETMIAQRISMLSGVAQVNVYGGQKYAVRIQVDPRQLATRGIGFDDVMRAVRSNNVNLPTGILWGPEKSYTIQTAGQLTSAEAYRPIVVTYRDGKPVRLEELGNVLDSVENNKTAAWFVDQRSIMLAIQKQPGTNTVAVARSVRELLPTFEQHLPASVSMHIVFDRSESIRDSVHDVKVTLLVTLTLVVLVIFLFLRNLSATAIPSLAMPMSIVGTFAVMYLLDYSVDNLSLMALTLSVGFVVDDAIVMLENIFRHMEMGKKPFQAALDGSREIGFTIVSMTLSLAAVFLPVLFMGGIVGRLFQEFAVTIGVAVLISGFISLTLTPMLSSRFLRPPREVEHHALYNFFERAFNAMLNGYKAGLSWSLAHRRTMMAITAAITILMGFLFAWVPKGFIPSQDVGMLSGQTEAVEGISFDSMARHQQAIADILKKDPNIEVFGSSAGGRGGSSNSGFLFIRLKPRDQRELSADEIVEELRPKLAAVPGVRTYIQSPPAIQIGGRQSRALYQLTLFSPSTEDLYRFAPELETKMRANPLLQDVSTDLLLKNPQINVEIQRDRAAALGVTAQQIEDTLYTAYGTRQISTIFAPQNSYMVIMEAKPEFQTDITDLSLIYVRSTNGQLVPLDSLVNLTPGIGPLTVNHSGQLPSVTLSFNLKPGVALGQATAEVERLAKVTLPSSISNAFQGTAQAFQSSMQGLGLLLVLAVLVIYMVLAILYESFIHPFTILSALPLAGAGALATLALFRTDLNIYAFVGIIMLVGLVKKNGIIMIDFAIETQRTGKSPMDAIYEACVVRFRPIMMTTMAALFGTLPIALGWGAGAEARRPLGLAVVGGLVVSQSLTLFVTPVVYTYMESVQTRLGTWLWFLGGRKKQAVATE
ncbi:MAG TPA: efflux RND transporter permease subunit [Thermoanaerobaculaceae bacterium]|nr:efflux RND transporter permease subunit [Thermoanaerobaculaceae bacterium]